LAVRVGVFTAARGVAVREDVGAVGAEVAGVGVFTAARGLAVLEDEDDDNDVASDAADRSKWPCDTYVVPVLW
jgi:hypothetical protein